MFNNKRESDFPVLFFQKKIKQQEGNGKMIPISVCIIAKNEEEFIGECLERLKPYGFELIVVDTGSEDNTKFIASKYTDEIYNFVWCNDFSKARNYAASKAKNDWILCVDCDEHLQEIDIDHVLEFIKQKEVCGMVEIQSPTSMEENSAATIVKLRRLYNKNVYEFSGIIHEQIVRKDGNLLTEAEIPVSFFHYGYIMEGKRNEVKQERNIGLLKAQLKKEKSNPYLYFQLGRSYRMLKDYKQALGYFEKAITLDFDPNILYGKLLVVDYAQTLLDLGDAKKALRIEMLKDMFDDFADYIFMLGRVYYENGQIVKAMQQFIKVMGMEEGALKGTTTYLSYFMLARIYHDIGDKDMEATFLQKYNEAAPSVS